ncbi:MAG: Gfo/Idh/MocA family oxidoreductase [Phycisphaeraceae bacterium]|nr:Gfo/Idh/MocA family oxidoreductase [Phycisphaerae bacterium]MBX3391362.1 Gfo/Idh/MocA family oxidoreductase [Phycisphaeraceae bacterium]
MPDRRSMFPVSRRTFLKSAALASPMLAMPALSWGRIMGSNDRITIGVIGTGGMGTVHVEDFLKIQKSGTENIEVIRVCDVYRRRLNNAVRLIGGSESSGSMEYERVIDDRDVSAVLIATPDHWHTKMAIEAMDAGKDVYCEKPLSLTIEQAIECRDAVRRTGRVLQVGPQGTSEDRWWKAREIIGSGKIGRVVWSQGAYCRNSREGQFNWRIDPDAGPSSPSGGDGYIDWDRWLGHRWGLAPKIEWNADHFFRFRKYYAYNGGVATDLMYHRLAPLLIAIAGPNGQYPRRVSASGGLYIENDGRDIGDTMILNVDYDAPYEGASGHTVTLASVMVNDVGLEDAIRGQYGTLRPRGGGWSLTEQSAWAKEFRAANAQAGISSEAKPGEASLEIASGSRRNHKENWFDAIRGKAQPHCNIELGCATMVAIKMGVESFRRSQTLVWDARKEAAVVSGA